MTDDSANTQAVPQPNPGLENLEKLVGTWNVSGPDISGQVRYEWLEGGFFLVQHFDFVHSGHKVKGLELIGYEKGFGAEPSQDIKSHIYDNLGNTFEYVYEVSDDTLMIWAGEKGSPARYRGEWRDDGNTNAGAWVYPGGGGYDSTMTRVKEGRDL